MKSRITSRRQFVQATAAGSALASLSGARVAAQPAGKSSGPKTLKTDVLVCGGGCAGTAAALAAARRGAKVLLVDHSATRGAHASTRVTVTAMAMGEAAGTAAALAVAAKKTAQEIPGVKVREALKASGVGPFTEA